MSDKKTGKSNRRKKYHQKFCVMFTPSLLPRLRELSKVELDVLIALGHFAEINCYVKTSLKELQGATAHHQSSISEALKSLCELNFIMKITGHNSLYLINPDYLWIGNADEYHGDDEEALIEQGLELTNISYIYNGEVFAERKEARHEYDTSYLVSMLGKKRQWRQGKRKGGGNVVQ